MTILVNDAEYICNNVTEGCCSAQSADVSAADSNCWETKPAPKQAAMITPEALEAMAAGTATTCVPWTSGYSWRQGEQACSNATEDTMYSCLDTTLCQLIGPYATTMYDNLSAIGAVGTTTALVGTGDSDTVWKNRDLPVAKYDPTNPDNCYTTWTEGMNYPKGATLCDGIIYQCEDPAQCGVYVPGADGTEATWSQMEGASVPSSQTKTYEYYDRTLTYTFGDFAISRTDQQTYKCTSETAGNC